MMEEYEDPNPPAQCPECGSKETKRINKDWIDNLVCEYELRCAECNHQLAYWSYGSWIN